MTNKELAVASLADVSAQLTGYLVECELKGSPPAEEAWEFVRALEQRMKISYSRFRYPKQAQMLFYHQVRRELARRAAAGTLVKRGSRPARWVTPAVSAEEDRREQEAAERQMRCAEERQQLEERLGGLGVAPARREGFIVLSHSQWSMVLDLAERGKQATA